jgi:ribonuclease Z
MTFSLTVLGSSAAIPAYNRNLSAHLLNVNERFFLFDCGEGTQFQLRKYHYSYRKISHILISHLHGDHFFGLIGLLNSMHLLGRKEELHLYADARLQEILDHQMEASMTCLNFQLIFHSLVMGKYQLLLDDVKFSIHSFPLRHSIPCCGFVVREKKPPRRTKTARSYAYCSDTVFDESIVQYIQHVSLLYHEATFMQNMAHAAAEKFHSTAMEAALIAKKAVAGKLLLGHFSARYEDLTALLQEARSVFPASFLPVEGTKIEIGIIDNEIN